MKKAFLPLMAIVLLISCKSSDSKIEAMSNRTCDCLGTVTSSMSEDTKTLMVKAASEADPETGIKNALEALPNDKKMAVATDLMKLAQLQDPSSEVGKCMKKADDDYKVMETEKKEVMEKVIKLMESKKGCEISAAIAKMGLKKM